MTGTTFLCLHGLGRSAADWDGVRAGLERYGVVHTPNLPRATIDELLTVTSDLPPATILVGHSLGGVVALGRAALSSTPVTGLILTDSFYPPARNGRSRRVTAADYAWHRLAVWREIRARGARPQLRASTARAMRSLARLGLRPQSFHTMASAVGAPVLVLHGREDHYVPVDFAIAAAAQHPAWRVTIVDAAGHDMHVQHPGEWLAAASSWLDGLVAP